MIGFALPPLNPTKVDLWTLKKLLCETVNQLKLELILESEVNLRKKVYFKK